MLSLLSGRAHTVYTGVTVRRGTFSRTAHEATQVRFRPLTQSEISAYIATGEPMDKAGAYGIQGRGCVLVEGIDGNYHNVVGLPTCLLAGLFTQIAPIQSLLQVAVPEFLWSLCWMPLVYLIFRSIFRRVGGTRLA